MAIVECPHCKTRVAPKVGGVCPSCREDVNDARGTDLDMTTVVIYEGEDLPPVCVGCGTLTDERRRVGHTGEPRPWEGVHNKYVKFIIDEAFGLWRSIFTRRSAKRTRWDFVVKLPQCGHCLEIERGEIRNIDTQGSGARLYVHHQFKLAVLAKRARE